MLVDGGVLDLGYHRGKRSPSMNVPVKQKATMTNIPQGRQLGAVSGRKLYRILSGDPCSIHHSVRDLGEREDRGLLHASGSADLHNTYKCHPQRTKWQSSDQAIGALRYQR